MSSKRGGLGRGLEALIPGIGAEGERAGTTEVDIDAIEPNPYQPRAFWNDDELESLAASIKAHGIIQPLLVSRGGSTKPYQIIAGERRWRAAQRAGLSAVPVIVRETTNMEALELALVENIQRADLNPLEEALAYRQLATEFDLTQTQIAERVGKSRPAIANAIRLLSATAEVRQALADQRISAGHARALLMLESAIEQNDALELVIDRELTVRETERLVKRLLAPPPLRVPDPPRFREVAFAEDSLRRALSTKVEVRKYAHGGRIVISFNSDEELNALHDRIVGIDPSEDYDI